jgi:hypothetical protein
MKLWRLLAVLLFIGGVSILSGCGDSNFDSNPGGGVAFTPTPAPTPIPKQCGNGEIDAGEECDPPMDGACTGDQECVCCLCLSPGEDLGTHPFTIGRPPSGLYSSGLGGTDVAVGLETLPGPLLLHAGRPDPTLQGEEACSAPLTIEQDVIIGFRNPLGYNCTKITAEGSSGTIDCDGGTAHNVEYIIDSNGNGQESDPVIRTNLGRCCTAEDGVMCAAEPAEPCDPEAEPSECGGEFPVCTNVGAGPGAATLQSPLTLTVLLSLDSTLDDCNCLVDATTPQEAFDLCPAFAVVQSPDEVVVSPVALTTEIAQGMVLNPAQGGTPPEIQRVGDNLVCANWGETDAEGLLVMPLSGLDQPVVQDTVNIYVLGDQAPELP